jgi:hypothetical protein
MYPTMQNPVARPLDKAMGDRDSYLPSQNHLAKRFEESLWHRLRYNVSPLFLRMNILELNLAFLEMRVAPSDRLAA